MYQAKEAKIRRTDGKLKGAQWSRLPIIKAQVSLQIPDGNFLGNVHSDYQFNLLIK